MNKTKQVLSLMDELKKTLEEERQVLVENNGERLVELIEEKEEILIQLAEFNEEDVKLEELRSLSQEIKELQEINLTLTEQSLSFSEMLLDNIQKNAQKTNAYSKKGKYEQSDSATFIDESL